MEKRGTELELRDEVSSKSVVGATRLALHSEDGPANVEIEMDEKEVGEKMGHFATVGGEKLKERSAPAVGDDCGCDCEDVGFEGTNCQTATVCSGGADGNVCLNSGVVTGTLAADDCGCEGAHGEGVRGKEKERRRKEMIYEMI